MHEREQPSATRLEATKQHILLRLEIQSLEYQAAFGRDLAKQLLADKTGNWLLLQSLDMSMLDDAAGIQVAACRDELDRTGLTESEKSALSDADVLVLASIVRQHILGELLADETALAARKLLEERAPKRGFNFTDKEQLFNRVSHQRFMELIKDRHTLLYAANVSQNAYGEFLYVTAARPTEHQPQWVTFFGLGLHEYRDRYLVDEWWWYGGPVYPKTEDMQPLVKSQAINVIDERRDYIRQLSVEHEQSKFGATFEMLAESSDDDSVIADYQEGLLDELLDE